MKRLLAALLVAIGAAGACAPADDEASDNDVQLEDIGPSGDDDTTTVTEARPTTTDAPTTTEPAVVPLPSTANPTVAGEGDVGFGPGVAGELAVVAQAVALDRSGSLPIVVRNMTDEPLASVSVTGTARDASGALVASGEDQGLQPFLVGPGEIAFGYVYFSIDGVPEGSTFALTATGEDPDDLFARSIDLTVAEFNRTGDAIIGLLRNDSTTPVSGPIGVDLMCFDANGVPTDARRTYSEPDEAPPGGTVSFTFDFFGDPPCDRYLLGGNGYDF